MQKRLFMTLPVLAMLVACSAGPVDETKTAECSQLMGRIIQPPAAQQPPGSSNFLNQYQQVNRQESYRAHARKAGCLE